MDQLEQSTGKLIHVDLEPEPGCVLQRSQDVVVFFEESLDPLGQMERLRRHIRVCHDTCHAAVMFEDQAAVFDRYQAAGIRVGKVQVSSALRVAFDRLTHPQRAESLAQLRAFQEDRYLHQTVARLTDESGAVAECFYDDLSDALATCGDGGVPSGEWRVHFHVPLYLDRIGMLSTTADQIPSCLHRACQAGGVQHIEAETYAWGVLPEAIRGQPLADGIARELTWLAGMAKAEAPP